MTTPPSQQAAERVHRLKTWPEPFKAVRSGDKGFEYRKNDRDFQHGDILVLEEYDPATGQYSGECEHCRVSYICHGGQWGLPIGDCVMAIQPLSSPNAEIVEELRNLIPYLRHKRPCMANHHTDGCTCGLTKLLNSLPETKG